MNAIEEQIRLPEEARPLDSYARYYAAGPKGEVTGVYVVPFPDIGPDDMCEEVAEDMTTRTVACSRSEGSANSLKAGERRWLDNHRNLPVVLDGGCSVVTVEFNPATREVEQVICNGVA